jgi:O-antigen ligase
LTGSLVAVIPPAAALAFWRPGHDVFMTVKATVVVVGALAVTGSALVWLARSGRFAWPTVIVAVPLGLYVASLVAATAAADRTLLAVVGRAGRHTGSGVALASVVLLVAAAVAYRDRRPDPVVAGVLVVAVPVMGYALVQMAGADPFEWTLVEGGPAAFSTLGNTNFVSAWLGMIVPLAAWGALSPVWRAPWRAASGAVGAAALLTAAATGSAQGVVAGAVGLAVTLGAWLLASRAPGARSRAAASGAIALAGAAALAMVVFPGGLVGGVTRSLETRLAHWGTAWRMAADHPWRGVGPAHFSSWFRMYEAPEVAAARGLDRGLDSPHNVPLELLTAGGWPLLLSWVAVVAAICWVAVAAWRGAARERRLLIAGLGGAWVAYLTQGLVSIDVPPLSVLGWVLGGLLVGVSGAVGERTVPIRAARPIAAGLLLGLLPLASASLAPMRADLAAARALEAEAHGDVATARAAYVQASAVGMWEPRYRTLEGAFHNRHGQREEALAAHEDAHRRDRRAVGPLLNVARLSLALGRPDRARQAYAEAVAVAPHAPEVTNEAARFLRD